MPLDVVVIEVEVPTTVEVIVMETVGGTGGGSGLDGKTILSGTTAPSNSLGTNGDFYIRLVGGAPSTIQGPKTSGVWPAAVSVIGPQGAPGAAGNTIRNGIGVPSNALGIDGDFYINLTDWHMFGPKAGGVWPAGTSLILAPDTVVIEYTGSAWPERLSRYPQFPNAPRLWKNRYNAIEPQSGGTGYQVGLDDMLLNVSGVAP